MHFFVCIHLHREINLERACLIMPLDNQICFQNHFYKLQTMVLTDGNGLGQKWIGCISA